MRSLRQRQTGELQDERGTTLSLSLGQATADPRVPTPRVIEPLDEIQARPTSQSRRVSGAGSASHWSRAEVALAGSKLPVEEPPRTFQLVRAWDGLVTLVTNETLVVRVVPIDGQGAEEEAEFLITDVPEEDRPLIQRGAPLFWFVGYETDKGRRRRTSELKMRRVNVAAKPSERWLEDIESIIQSASDSVPTEG